MSAQYGSEYTKPAVMGAACNYNTLGHYYGPNSTMPPLKPGQTRGAFITPNYSAIGYDALTHGSDCCGFGYPSIQNAYGKNSGNCNTTYSTRLCGGLLGGGNNWACDNVNGTNKCVKVHPGTFHAGGTFRSKKECMNAGCPHKV